MKIKYNSPVILTFAIIATVVTALNESVYPRLAQTYFAVGHTFVFSSVLSWFRLISHCIGHGGWAHLFGNFTMILLVGPILEEKYGSDDLLLMIIVTSLATGILNMVFFPKTLLLGASGIVFMLIILASMANFRQGEIPLTFVLVAILFLGSEIVQALRPDKISQFAHIIGGIVGAGFGFMLERRRGFGK